MILALSVARPRPLSPRTRNKVVRASEEAGFSAAPPWKMSGTPPRIKSACSPPGTHNAQFYSGLLGLTPEEIVSISERRVI